jgi:hypothetical protein
MVPINALWQFGDRGKAAAGYQDTEHIAGQLTKTN